jgi:parallel beta-helix repeat protein
MKNKIVVIFVCMLLVATVGTVAWSVNNDINNSVAIVDDLTNNIVEPNILVNTSGVLESDVIWDNSLPDGRNACSVGGWSTYQREIVDDFELNSSTILNDIHWRVVTYNDIGPEAILGIVVRFFADYSGVPSITPIAECTNIIFKGDLTGNIYFNRREIYLNCSFSPVLLSAGKWWVGCYPLATDNIMWLTSTKAGTNQIYISYPDAGYPKWTPGSTCFGDTYDVSFTLTGTIAGGAHWWVSAIIGDDSNSGRSRNDPFRTINKAVSVCTQNDLIYVLNGTYQESVSIIVPTGITIIAVDGPSVTFVETDSFYEIAFFIRSKGIRIENFTLQNSNMGVYITDSDNNIIVNNTMRNNYYGICLRYYSSNNKIIGNTITANLLEGILLMECDNTLIFNNRITFNNFYPSAYGIYCYSDSSSNNLIYNNYFDNTRDARDDGTSNHWNIDPIQYFSGITLLKNICGGLGIGGNRWSGATGINCPGSPAVPIPGNAGSTDMHPIPGFELLVFIAAFVIALLILRKRKNK